MKKEHKAQIVIAINRAIREIKKQIPECVIFADVALDPYTTHGHDGV